VDDLFAARGSAWRRVSPSLATVRRLVLGGVALVALVALLFLALTGLLPNGPVAVISGATALALAWSWWAIGRSVARWGYAEEDEELLITSGAFFRRLVVVPYGRMQYVDVQSGPLDQLFGIATVRLHTASPGTSARIPGLTVDEAGRLRDRLTALGESQAAGL
jgi:hypothetical protein